MRHTLLLLSLILVAPIAAAVPFDICFISDNPEPACFVVEAEQLQTVVVQKEESMTIDIDGVDIDFNCNSDKTVCEVSVGPSDGTDTDTGTNTDSGNPCFSGTWYIGQNKPECDNDNDGVPNGNDQCPEENGTSVNGGCPTVDYGDMVGQIPCTSTDKMVCKTDTDYGNQPRPEADITAPQYQRVTMFTDGRVLSMPFTVAPGTAESYLIVNTVREPRNGAALKMWISLTPGGAPLGPLDCAKSNLPSRERFSWNQGGGAGCELNQGGGYYWQNFASCVTAISDYNCSRSSVVLPTTPHIFWISAPPQ